MVVKDTVPSANPVTVYTEKDIPTTLSQTNQEQIRLALKGNVNAPSKIVVYVLESAAENYADALDYFSLKKVRWLCFPTASTDQATEEIVTWVKAQRGEKNRVKAVLPSTEADTEGVVNYATTSASVGEKTYTAEQFCSRITGLLAGTPSSMAVTFSVLEDVTACDKLSRAEADEAVEDGKLILFDDGEKIKVARGVNSLTTLTGKSAAWQKIKVVETIDTICDDLTLLIEDQYIGKYMNTYDNKCLVLGAAGDYLKELLKEGLINSYTIDFDEEAIKDYLVENGGFAKEEVEAMNRNTLIQQNTGSNLFLAGTVSILDAIEDIAIELVI